MFSEGVQNIIFKPAAISRDGTTFGCQVGTTASAEVPSELIDGVGASNITVAICYTKTLEMTAAAHSVATGHSLVSVFTSRESVDVRSQAICCCL